MVVPLALGSVASSYLSERRAKGAAGQRPWVTRLRSCSSARASFVPLIFTSSLVSLPLSPTTLTPLTATSLGASGPSASDPLRIAQWTRGAPPTRVLVPVPRLSPPLLQSSRSSRRSTSHRVRSLGVRLPLESCVCSQAPGPWVTPRPHHIHALPPPFTPGTVRNPIVAVPSWRESRLAPRTPTALFLSPQQTSLLSGY